MGIEEMESRCNTAACVEVEQLPVLRHIWQEKYGPECCQQVCREILDDLLRMKL
jgi:hypothetical protein